MKRIVLRGLCLAALAVVGWTLVTSVPIKAGLLKSKATAASKPAVTSKPKKPVLPVIKPPTLSCVDSTRIRITLEVCAGTLGLPHGFSIQWQTLENYTTYGDWKDACQADFTKEAGFCLKRNECIEVDIGDSLADQGAETSCVLDTLACSTTYVFRLVYSGPLDHKVKTTRCIECSTQECGGDNGGETGGDNGGDDGGDDGGGGCFALSQGYWKNHTDDWPESIVNAGGLTIGNIFYDLDELEQILNTSGTMGNKLPQLAHQVIAVEFSVAEFGWAPNSGDIQDCLAAAHAAIGDQNILTDTDTDDALADLTECLDDGYIQVYDCGT